MKNKFFILVSTVVFLSSFVSCGEKHVSDDFVKITGTIFISGSGSKRKSPRLIPTFCISKYEVTQELYESIMGENPSQHTGEIAEGENIKRRPVEGVSLYEAMVFCNMLSEKENLTPVYSEDEETGRVRVDNRADGYRLPSVDEWMFAARGGDKEESDVIEDYDEYAWYRENSGNTTHEVGKKKKNKFGLYDMNGNVMEWCYSDYSDDARLSLFSDDDTEIAVAGGSFSDEEGKITNESTVKLNESFMEKKYSNIGFRIMRIISWRQKR